MILNEKVIFDKAEDFEHYSKFFEAVETGLEFHLDSTSVSNKLKKNDNYNNLPEDDIENPGVVEAPIIRVAVPDTYKKVLEVQEMNEAEINIANKIRYVLKLCFEGFFRGDNVRAWCSGLYAGFVAYDLIKENYVAAIILFGCCLIYTDVNVGFKVLKDYFTSKKREKLEKDLEYYGILEYTNAMKCQEDVKMYSKFRRMN